MSAEQQFSDELADFYRVNKEMTKEEQIAYLSAMLKKGIPPNISPGKSSIALLTPVYMTVNTTERALMTGTAYNLLLKAPDTNTDDIIVGKAGVGVTLGPGDERIFDFVIPVDLSSMYVVSATAGQTLLVMPFG
jgi:hypothetical protein